MTKKNNLTSHIKLNARITHLACPNFNILALNTKAEFVDTAGMLRKK